MSPPAPISMTPTMSAISRFRLSSERSPSVIDAGLICSALQDELTDDGGAGRGKAQLTAKEQETEEAFLIKTCQTLRLEFRQILKVENLHCLTSLTRLFLDNNFIERISGLDQLYHLTWLDLSFNRISRVEGLEATTKLEVLALFGNQIEHVDNVFHLERLKVLRLGRNRISSKDEVVKLRRLPALRTLSIKENPFCFSSSSSDDHQHHWEEYVIALLPNLSYLECHSVTSERREVCVSRHQGDIFRAQNQEEAEEEEKQRRVKEADTDKRQRAAFVSSLKGETLLRALLQAKADEEGMLGQCMEGGRGRQHETWRQQFCEEIVSIGDDMHRSGLRELEAREEEVRLFEECVKGAQKASQAKGIEEIDSFLEEKERIFEAVFELASQFEDKEPEEVTDLQKEEVERLRELFIVTIRDLWNSIMANEVTLVNQIEQVLLMFEANLKVMIRSFVDDVRSLFVRARSVDVRYFKKLSELGEAIEELPYSNDNDENKSSENEETATTESPAPPPLRDGQRVSSLISQCHDAHQNLLLQLEERLQESVNKWRDDFLAKFRKKERRRNRNRILELNHFVDTMRQEEEEELDVLPSNDQYTGGEDILLMEY